MEIWHRVGFSKQAQVTGHLDDLGITYTKVLLPGESYVVHFDICESDANWSMISILIKEHNASDMWNTIFTQEEIKSAEWLRLTPIFEQGYPQPADTMAWRESTFELVCQECGVIYHQKAPFRLAKEPRMGRNEFLTLYWAYALFCTPKVVTIFRESELYGYETVDALIHKTSQPSRIVTQLRFPLIASPGLAEEDKQQPDYCEQCGITKYAYHKVGYMHYQRASLQPNTDFQMTNEWFGSGGKNAFREFLVSSRVAKLVLEQGWRGVTFKPLQLI